MVDATTRSTLLENFELESWRCGIDTLGFRFRAICGLESRNLAVVNCEKF